jgi:UDP-N-acetylmuramate--alanine ligase
VNALAIPAHPCSACSAARPVRAAPLHVIGVGGPGMSAIALALAQMGHAVSGSRPARATGPRPAPRGRRHRPRRPSPLPRHGCDAVTASTAIPSDLNELDEARKLGIPTLSRAGMLASICAQARSLAVAGTHGKTTTTSMLMLILAEADLRPSFVIGGDVNDMGTGAQWTGGEWFVVEADESDGTHLELPLHGTILTNVEVDHLDHYGSFEAIVDAFDRYLAQIPGPKVVCVDDRGRRARRGGRTTTSSPTAPRPSAIPGRRRPPVHGSFRSRSSATVNGSSTSTCRCAACTTSQRHGCVRDGDRDRRRSGRRRPTALARSAASPAASTSAASTAVRPSSTTTPTCPTEIDAVLRGARDSGDGWQRVVAVFQPNRYNRMAEMWQDYADAFEAADVVVLTDIYASGTEPIPGVTGKLVVNAVLDAHPRTRVVWLPRRDDLVAFLADGARRRRVHLDGLR